MNLTVNGKNVIVDTKLNLADNESRICPITESRLVWYAISVGFACYNRKRPFVGTKHVCSFSEVLENLVQGNFELVEIQVDNVLHGNHDRINVIIDSIMTVARCAKKTVPKISVWSQGFRQRLMIKNLIESEIDFIYLNLDTMANKEIILLEESLSSKKKYTDPITRTLYNSYCSGNKKKVSLLSEKIRTGTVAYYICPSLDLVRDQAELFGTYMKRDFNLETVAVSHIIDLFPLLSDPLTQMDILWIDAEEIQHGTSADVYQIINTITTLIETTGRKNRTKFLITVDSSTPIDLMRNIVKMPGVYALTGRYPEFSYNELAEQIKKILQDRDPTPKKIKAWLSGKNVKHKNTNNLTTREIQIKDLLCQQGSSNKVIARSLGISEATIKRHIGSVYKKYGVKCRTELLIKLQSL